MTNHAHPIDQPEPAADGESAADAVQAFTAWLRENDRSDKTVILYRKLVGQFAAWYAGANGHPLTAPGLTPADVRQYREALIAQGRKPSSINAALAALRAFGRWIAETRGGPNPAERVRAIARAAPAAPKSLDKQAQYKLRQALDRRAAYAERKGYAMAWIHRDEAIITTLLHTGIRVGELCALDLADVALHDRSGKLVIRRGKGMKYREVPLNSTAREALRAWLKYRAGIAGADGADGEGRPALFVTKYRERLRSSAVERLLRELGKDAGVSVTPHTLRHTFAKSLVDAGTGIERVAAILGHSSLNTTRLYTTPTEQDLAAAVERLAE